MVLGNTKRKLNDTYISSLGKPSFKHSGSISSKKITTKATKHQRNDISKQFSRAFGKNSAQTSTVLELASWAVELVGIHRWSDRGDITLVEEPTRGKNTLDLFATNAPSKIIKVEVLPGISDHDIVAIEVDISPKRRKQKPRKIHLYSKAQWSEFEEKVNELPDELLSKFESKFC